MAILGLVGGMSWHSSALYYRRFNAACEHRFGYGATIESVLFTLSFASLTEAAERGDWAGINAMIVDAAMRCERAGADAVMLTAFTGHVAAQAVGKALSVPLLHAGDALAQKAQDGGHCRVGLLGTKAMLEAGIIEKRLAAAGLGAIKPDTERLAALDDAIMNDLTRGNLSSAANRALDDAIAETARGGATAALLACTELPLLLDGRPRELPVIDGVEAHVASFLDMQGGEV